MSETPTRPDIEAIERRHRAARPGPYVWSGNVRQNKYGFSPIRSGSIELSGRGNTVMGFFRFGMNGAQPYFNVDGLLKPSSEMMIQPQVHNPWFVRGIDHPDAIAIAHSWQDREDLLAYIRHLEGERASVAAAEYRRGVEACRTEAENEARRYYNEELGGSHTRASAAVAGVSRRLGALLAPTGEVME